MNRKTTLNVLKNYSYRYIDEIVKYLEFTLTSNVIKNNTDNLTHIGYRIITQIFQTNLIHTNDLDALFFSMQKGYLYYLEYLEQTENKSNKDLNYQSATLFIYDKTILKYTQDNHTPINIDLEILSTIPRVTKLIELIMWFDNNLIQQNDIEFDIVKSICELLHNSDDNLINSLIEFGQKRTMNTIEYNEFLNHAFKILRKNLKHKTYSERDWKDQIIKKFPSIEESTKLSVSKWCKWLWF